MRIAFAIIVVGLAIALVSSLQIVIAVLTGRM